MLNDIITEDSNGNLIKKREDVCRLLKKVGVEI
jgi:hypothetical protein